MAATAGAAVIVHQQVKKTAREHPAVGQFVDVDGVRLHYVERGEGPPVVLLHGNLTLGQDFELSGVLDLVSARHRVIAFDRPGYGHSTRPRGRVWTPDAQAELLRKALTQLGVEQATVVGHSWGTLVALAMALRHPEFVSSLVLVSGYYFPSLRLDVPYLAMPAMPMLGTLLRHTYSPLLGRMFWPALKRVLFGPMASPGRFDALKDLAMRPSQIQASAAEAALMVPAAASLSRRYGSLRTRTIIMAGFGDRLVRVKQSQRLHAALPGSVLQLEVDAGHMLHYQRPRKVAGAIAAAAAMRA
jgi:pimeloyl-ACP methyl ester carboxylesterase